MGFADLLAATGEASGRDGKCSNRVGRRFVTLSCLTLSATFVILRPRSNKQLGLKKEADSRLSASFVSLPRHDGGVCSSISSFRRRGPYSSLLKGTLINCVPLEVFTRRTNWRFSFAACRPFSKSSSVFTSVFPMRAITTPGRRPIRAARLPR